MAINKSRGLRKKAGTDDQVPALIDSDISRQAFRKNWARLIQKIYNVDPLLCPKCSGSMRIISLIADQQLVKKILKSRPRQTGELYSNLPKISTPAQKY